MKKVYMTPAMEKTQVETEVIATSIPTAGGTSGGGVTTMDAPEVNDFDYLDFEE